jgi:hypothetical protein
LRCWLPWLPEGKETTHPMCFLATEYESGRPWIGDKKHGVRLIRKFGDDEQMQGDLELGNGNERG